MDIKKRKKLPKLWYKTKNGQVRSFSIKCNYYNSDKVILITKKKVEPNGKITYDKYIYNKGKNIGKANETTAWEQCLSEATSIFNRLKDKGYTEDLDIVEPELKPMLAVKYNKNYIKFPCMVQPKLDGVRCIVFEGKDHDIHLKSRRNKELILPHIKEYLSKHRDLLPLDGELYNHKELTFQEIISAVKKLSDKTNKIVLTVYDKPIPSENNYNRWSKLIKKSKLVVKKKDPIKFLETKICNSLEEIYAYHDKCVSEGYEGIIIRNFDGLYEFGYRSNNLIKYKKFSDEEFEVLDIVEATGRDKGTGIFILKTKEGKVFKARPQGNKVLRASYLLNRSKLIGKYCTVKYQELSTYGIPRFPSVIAIRDYE